MAVKVDSVVIPMRALTAREKAEMAEEAPTREALWRYLTPLPVQIRIDRRRRLNALTDRIALRMEHRRGGDVLTRANERMMRQVWAQHALENRGEQPTRWQDLRRVAAAKVYWIFRDRIEKPAGLDGYEWAAIKREDGQ